MDTETCSVGESDLIKNFILSIKNDSEACYILASSYFLSGRYLPSKVFVPQDGEVAIQLMKKAARLGNEKAKKYFIEKGINLELEHKNEKLKILELLSQKNEDDKKILLNENAIASLKKEKEDLEKECNKIKSLPDRQQKTLLITGYFSFFIILLCFFYLVYWGVSVVPEVHVELNIGELIGGSLVGIGAALAGGAYAIKTLSIHKESKE